MHVQDAKRGEAAVPFVRQGSTTCVAVQGLALEEAAHQVIVLSLCVAGRPAACRVCVCKCERVIDRVTILVTM